MSINYNILSFNGNYLSFDIVGSPSFDPSITNSTVGKWDFGDGTSQEANSVTKVYPNTNTYHITYQNRSLSKTTSLYMANDGITGVLDLSKLIKCTIFDLFDNRNLTSIINPITNAIITRYAVYNNGLNGILDLSGLNGLGGSFSVSDNYSLTSIINPISSQIFTGYQSYNCNLTGTLDLSGLSGLGGILVMFGNPNLTSIIFPMSSQYISDCRIYSCNLTGTLDLSGLSGLGGSFEVFNNPSLASIINPINNRTFTRYAAYGCTIDYIDFTTLPNMTSINNHSSFFTNNKMSSAQVNHILVDLDTISIAGYTGRTIGIGGNNAAPDGTSGGYDGLAAKASLQAKGFTVTTS